MANRFLRSIGLGLKRRGWAGVRAGLAALGAAWTVTEVLSIASMSTQRLLERHGSEYLWLMAFLFAIAVLTYIYEPREVDFKIPTTNTKVHLKFADLFSQRADLVIGVNEFFDGELGVPGAKNSVHGQLIVRNFGGSSLSFRAQVDPALATCGSQPKSTERAFAPSDAYPVGTTVCLSSGDRKLFLTAIATTDLYTSKARSDVPMLWAAMRSCLQKVHECGNGDPLAMPLIGNGQSGVNLKPQHLLRLLVLILVDFATSSESRLPKTVVIALHDSCFDELDIREIARDWKNA